MRGRTRFLRTRAYEGMLPRQIIQKALKEQAAKELRSRRREELQSGKGVK